ncbi:MAG: type I-E CRISPR-associated protein Cse2/CasB [Firmicutes bacterium]|nr:type I-E CRISPR-associated protein Cse2/CasB [Bacillota bacterium]
MAGEAKQARAFVKRKIDWLAESKGESAVRATLARLRRGIGKDPGSLPDLWDVTLSGMPEALLGKGEEPTYGERAVHTALTLYALHQQGKDLKKLCMNREGEFLGIAVRKLLEHDRNNEDAVRRRFNAVAMSDSFERFSWQLRGLIQILKAKDILLDYPALTEDLYWFQFPDKRDGIRLKWGQDFYRVARSEEMSSKAQITEKENRTNEEQ